MANSHDAYREIDAINISTLKVMRDSPAKYVYRLAHPQEDRALLMVGRAGHTLTLEPEKFAAEYAVFDGPRRAGQAWAKFEMENEGKTILRADEYERCRGIADAVRSHVIAAQYLAAGEAEKVLRWKDKATGLECKARLDWLSSSVPSLADLKITASIEARIFGVRAARLGHHLQAAFYTAGARANGLGELEFKIIAVEPEPPHEVAVFHVGEDELWAGEQEVAALLQRVAECRASGQWPSRYVGEQVLRLPAWAYGESESDEDDASGLDLEWSAA